MGQIHQFWCRLSVREQAVVGGGAAVLLIILLVFYVWQPLEIARARLRSSLPGMRVEAQQMRADAVAVPKLKRTAKPTPLAGGLKDVIEQSASALGVQVTQLNTQGNGKLSIMLAAVPFDVWVKWLASMQAQQAIRMESCHVEALPQAGMVKVQAVLAQ